MPSQSFLLSSSMFSCQIKGKNTKKNLQKETKLLLKIIPECTKSHRLFKNFSRGGGGGHAPQPPRMASRPRRSHSRIRRSGELTINIFKVYFILTICQPGQILSYVVNLCKQVGPRLGQTKCGAESVSNCLTPQMIS